MKDNLWMRGDSRLLHFFVENETDQAEDAQDTRARRGNMDCPLLNTIHFTDIKLPGLPAAIIPRG